MSSTNGARLLTRVQKQLKKQFEASVPDDDYSVLDYLILGVCLEDADLPAAEAVLQRLRRDFYDWNEVRVSSVRELEEFAKGLPNREEKALRIKGVLQSLFESTYSFELDDLRRKPLGQAAKRLGALDGVGPFALAFTVQMGLGGHAIPVDQGVVRLMVRLGIADEQADLGEIQSRLERYIPKARGQEFTALVRPLAAQAATKKKPEAVEKFLIELGLVEGKARKTTGGNRKKTAHASSARKRAIKKKR